MGSCRLALTVVGCRLSVKSWAADLPQSRGLPMHTHTRTYTYTCTHTRTCTQAVFSLAWRASVEIMFVHSPNGELLICFESRGVPTSCKVVGCRFAAKSWAADLPQSRGLSACRNAVVGCRLAVKSWSAGFPQSREFQTKTDETRPDRLTTEKALSR